MCLSADSPISSMKISLLEEPKDSDKETTVRASTSKESPDPSKVSISLSVSSQNDDSNAPVTSKSTKMYPASQSSNSDPAVDSEWTKSHTPFFHGGKSLTLPTREYPRTGICLKDFADSSRDGNNNDKEQTKEEESTLAKAVQERHNELANESEETFRVQANTTPERNSPLHITKSVIELTPKKDRLEEASSQSDDGEKELFPVADQMEMEPIKIEPIKQSAVTEDSQGGHLDRRELTIGSLKVMVAAPETGAQMTPNIVVPQPFGVQNQPVNSPPPGSITSR